VVLLVFYWTLDLFQQCSIICFSIGLWNCSDSVGLLVFLLDFGTVPTVWYYLFFYWTLNCSDSVALLAYLLDFGSVPTVWHY